jgi:hypothetical protein
MATAQKRIMISFPIEDAWARTNLVGQARNERSPFEFIDLSVKAPWDENWKTQCRIRIKGCHGVIAMITKNTAKATGQLWEVSCAKQERIPVIGVYATTDDRPATLPVEFNGVRIVSWTWANIDSFVKNV